MVAAIVPRTSSYIHEMFLAVKRAFLRVSICVLVLFAVPAAVVAQTFVASDAASLAAAITNANAAGGTIVISSNITLTSNLPAIDLSAGSITVSGGGFTVSGANTYQGLTVTNLAGNGATSTTIQNLTIANTVAAGANGG